jgi:outer membrane protein assembly factor BamB
MRTDRRPRLSIVGLALSGALVAAPALAQSFDRGGFLAGEGPSSFAPPVERPFMLGWEAAVSHPPGLLKTAYEPGGVAADPRTGWVYVATRDGRVVCLDGGRTRWEVEVGGALKAAPAVFEESVVVGTGQGVLAVLNKVTGERRSRAVLGEALVTTPLVVRAEDGKARAYVGSTADSVFAVDLELGQKLWRAHRDPPAPFSVTGFARPVLAAGALYLAFADGWVEARDPVSGQLRWDKRLSPAGGLSDVDALATNGQLRFAASASGGVYGLSLESGAIAWRTPMPGAGRLQVDGAMVYAIAPGLVRGLRAGDGRTVWSTRFGARMASTPMVVEHLVVVAEDDGALCFVDDRTGAPVGRFETGAGFETSPARNGRVLYALSNGGRVYSMSIVR